MSPYLISLGVGIWMSVENGYITPTTPPIYVDGRRVFTNNAKLINGLICDLDESNFVKVMHCKFSKDIWDKLEGSYEGDDNVKKSKLQTHKVRFEILKMNENKNSVGFFLRFNEVVNTIKGINEKVDEVMVVQEVLISLPIIFNAEISTIKEMKDLDSLNMEQLDGILTTYEIRIGKEGPRPKEVTFKV